MGQLRFQPGSAHGTSDPATDTEIVNSVFLQGRGGAVRVLDYIERSEFTRGWDTQTRVHGVIDAGATQRGRQVFYTDLPRSTGLDAALPSADVLFIYGQDRAGSATLDGIGAAWHDTLDAFLDAGGVIVILTSRDCHEEWRLVSGTGLFDVPLGAQFGRAVLEVVVPDDPVVAGVTSPYRDPTVDGLACFQGLVGGVTLARTDDEPLQSPPLPMHCPVLAHITR